MTNVILYKKFVDWNSNEESKWIISNATDPSEIEASWGDLFLVVDTAYINPLSIGEYGDLYVTKKDGSIVKAPRLPNELKKSNWLAIWNGQSNYSIENIIEYGCESVDGKRLVMTACSIARLVLHLVPKGEDRPRIAIETAEAWVRGEATIEEVIIARDNAWEAYHDIHAIAAAAIAAATAASAAAADAAATVAFYATQALPTDISYEILECINKYIPVSVAILAELGEEMPL